MVHNVVRAVVEGCRSTGLDVPTAFEDGSYQLSDSELLLRDSSLGRAVLTQDTDSCCWLHHGNHGEHGFPASYLHSMERLRSESHG